MKEALLILAVLLVLAALTAYRYRRQISAVLEFMHQVKAIREGIKRPLEPTPVEPISKGPLVHCQKCGSWVPEERAVKLGRSAIFCSAKCLESSKLAEHA
jgi:hypothetical protein